jgi:FAD/FMN-containing dehydrogenase
MSQTAIPAFEEATIAQLREAVRGQIFTPGSEGYDEAARIWNGAYDGRRPAVIVSCTGAADVIAAIAFARGNALEIAVRGGGHSVAGFSTGDNVMVIDLSPMNSVRVDTTTRWATVGGGAVWADVDHETTAHGLATTGGLVSSTGVAGFTLGGGIGWLMRKYGLAADNLIGADVVTADGRLVHACDSENSELFWGIRGGGGNFGIVTQFELELHPVGEAIYAGPIFYSAEADGDLLRRFREWAPGASDDVTAVINLTTAPPLPVIPQEWHGRKVAAFVAASAGPVQEGEGHVHGIREVAEPVADLLGPMPYKVIQTLLDPLWPKGVHAYFKATNLARLDDELIERLIDRHHAAPGPQCEIHIHQMGGAAARVADSDSAFADRSAPYVLNAVTGWHDPTQADAHINWARSVIDAAADASTGRAYVNFLGDSGAGRSAYGEETYGRLLALKQEYDPTNVFARNQNIDPRAGS